MKMRNIILIIVAAMVLATLIVAKSADAAGAGYVTNYTKWKTRSNDKKAGYVSGVIDSELRVSDFDDKAELARSTGIENCLVDLGLTDVDIADAVTAAYERNLTRWDNAADVMTRGVVYEICRKNINTQRIKYKLDAWKPWKNWK